MTARTFSFVAGGVFMLVALAQLTRALAGWEVTVGTATVPLWASYAVGLVAATLGWLGFTVRADRG